MYLKKSWLFLTILYSISVSAEIEVNAESKLSRDDNIYKVGDQIKVSDTYFQLAPQINFLGRTGKQEYILQYSGDYAKFNSFDEADYYDHKIDSFINLEHTSKLKYNLAAGFERAHEDPGSLNRVQLEIREYNKYERKYFSATAKYGQNDAIGQFIFGYRIVSRKFVNNDLDYLDYSADIMTGKFSYRLATRIRAYVDTLWGEYDYDPAQNYELDNTYRKFGIGLSWDFTNKLSGDVNIGYQERNYVQENLTDIKGLAYDGEINWKINTFTTLTAIAKRESIDSSIENTGGFLRSSYTISFEHALTPLINFEGGVFFSEDELAVTSGREDERNMYFVSISKYLSTKLVVKAEYNFEKRESTYELANYKSNLFVVGVEYRLGM